MDQVQLDIFEIVRKTMSGEEQRERARGDGSFQKICRISAIRFVFF